MGNQPRFEIKDKRFLVGFSATETLDEGDGEIRSTTRTGRQPSSVPWSFEQVRSMADLGVVQVKHLEASELGTRE